MASGSGIAPLPPGAAMPAAYPLGGSPKPQATPSPSRPEFSHNASSATAVSQPLLRDGSDESPPGTPRQRLLSPDDPAADATSPLTPNRLPKDGDNLSSRRTSAADHAQYATYPDYDQGAGPRGGTEKRTTWMQDPPAVKVIGADANRKPYVPLPLRPIFYIPFIVILVLGAVGLEIALHFSKKNNGWNTVNSFTTDSRVLHYVYTLPPVAVAAIITAMWTWTDFEIKKMQPYVDLIHGDSPPHRSLLLDYTRSNNFFVWSKAFLNRHYLVALASLMVLLSLSFQPLAAALLEVRSTWWTMPNPLDLQMSGVVGLNQNEQFQDLTAFLTASGYASSSVMYSVPPPSFVSGSYTLAPFELPSLSTLQSGGIDTTNGTVLYANTTAIKTDPGCRPLQVQMTSLGNGDWNNSISTTISTADGTTGTCSLQWQVAREADFLFGTNVTICDPPQPPQFSPVAFWFFTYQPEAKASATICQPTMQLFDVSIQLDMANGSVTTVKELAPFVVGQSNFSSAAGNVTGDPLDGRTYNGIEFNLTQPDPFVEARRNALQIQMPAAVFQLARNSPEGLDGSFDENVFVGLSTQVYLSYLTLIASTVYFVPPADREANVNSVLVRTVVDRVFLSDTAVHLLTTALLLLALFSSLIQLFHSYDRRSLHLRHEPGTIASAVSIGGQTEMGALLAEADAGKRDDKEIVKVLGERKFRIDPQSMKIVMEGEVGYEFARSPGARGDWRKSVFGGLQAQGVSKRLSRRLSSWGGAGVEDGQNDNVPLSPRTPRTPQTPGSAGRAQRASAAQV